MASIKNNKGTSYETFSITFELDSESSFVELRQKFHSFLNYHANSALMLKRSMYLYIS